MHVKVKICGITNPVDAASAIEAGADALGFVFWPKSPRNVAPSVARSIIKTLPPFIATVGVFVNEDAGRIRQIASEAGLSCVQLHGDETPAQCACVAHAAPYRVIKAFRVQDGFDIISLDAYDVQACLLDAYKPGLPGGTGEVFDWAKAVEAAKSNRIILSGGLTPDNVGRAVEMVRPYAVDVSSGVEASPGIKDGLKVRRFIEAVRAAGR
ncbi:MAG: N-(5'-phosphoribosyl)anthranilate isomerase [Deltaproteobacteria bacterium RIFCSPLOWO2_02_FULL_53_8]|nr:MAG: N-(5'-phosphoribosyl)anthranilate isomerase [Deltaproteobacteria bacterium RIFCSPLOWO2_02_FULL_53_8]